MLLKYWILVAVVFTALFGLASLSHPDPRRTVLVAAYTAARMEMPHPGDVQLRHISEARVTEVYPGAYVVESSVSAPNLFGGLT